MSVCACFTLLPCTGVSSVCAAAGRITPGMPISGKQFVWTRGCEKPRGDSLPDVDATSKLYRAAVDRIFREASGRSVATLIRVFGDIDVAEDAVQDAFAVALRKWPGDGVPPNPGGWI